MGTSSYSTIASYTAALAAKNETSSPPSCSWGTTSKITSKSYTHTLANPECPSDIEPDSIKTVLQEFVETSVLVSTTRVGSGTVNNLQCTYSDNANTTDRNLTAKLKWEAIGDPSCPESHPLGPVTYDDGNVIGNFCYYIPEDEPPPECNIGDCDPPDEPQCFLAGNGMEVCFEDPNEKCTKQTVNDEPVYINCEAGCGFVNGNFLCTKAGDIPSLDDCLVTTNGYACPSDTPPPNDEIEDPEKPINDMKKGDFKDVLIGVESRLDGTNKLIADQTARNADNTEKLSKGIGKTNDLLGSIEKSSKSISDQLSEGDGVKMPSMAQDQAEIKGMLGITGDETIDDLTQGEYSLDEFKSEFQWSMGGGSCPQPRNINFLGKTFYLEWDPFCQAFTVLGYFIMALAYYMSAMIAFGGRR